MKTVELVNTFHRTRCNVRPGPDGELSASQMRRAWRKLCGMQDCRCSHMDTATADTTLITTEQWNRDRDKWETVGRILPVD